VLAGFGLVAFLAAFLLFQIQPLAGKRLLPWFGGTATVWTTCLLFYQALLLVGYGYAHASARLLSARWQSIAHAVLLVGACFLPVLPADTWKPAAGVAPTIPILSALTATVGLRFLVLAGTAPLLQVWFARLWPQRSPYGLYALSNAGSTLALLSYPFFFEATLPLRRQTTVWATGFLALVVACTWIAWVAGRRGPADGGPSTTVVRAEATDTRVAPSRVALWVAWSACGVVLYMSVTNQMTINMASTPLLWVVPLAVYLLTFIVAFGVRRAYSRKWFSWLLAPVLLVLYPVILGVVGYEETIIYRFGWFQQLSVLVVSLGVLCMICHGELYRMRPTPARLTLFYLAIAVGGVLGGAFVALAAPRLFLLSVELHIGVLLCLALLLITCWCDPESRLHRGRPRWAWATLLLAALLPLVPLIYESRSYLQNAVFVQRNYYGMLRILRIEPEDGRGVHLRLYHGSTLHGSQFLADESRVHPTAYYAPSGGGGAVLQLLRRGTGRRIGVVGLGVGTLAAYGQADDYFRFYEIDPAVDRLAREWFSFLGDSDARWEVRLGDARLNLERDAPQRFDVLILDAFSSDAIPVHLLTTEAFDEYGRHLENDGVIAAHISNQYVDLTPVLYNLAERHGLHALNVVANRGRPEQLVSHSNWMILTRNTEVLEGLITYFRPLRETGEVGVYVGDRERYRTIPLWTDDYTNVFRIMKRPSR
jgi:hypothetical protein